MTNQVNQEALIANEFNKQYPYDDMNGWDRKLFKSGYQAATKASESEINSLKERVAELEAWKNSAISVESEWDCQSVGKALNIQLGHSIRANILPKIQELQADNLRLRELLKSCTDVFDNVPSRAHIVDSVDENLKRIAQWVNAGNGGAGLYMLRKKWYGWIIVDNPLWTPKEGE